MLGWLITIAYLTVSLFCIAPMAMKVLLKSVVYGKPDGTDYAFGAILGCFIGLLWPIMIFPIIVYLRYQAKEHESVS